MRCPLFIRHPGSQTAIVAKAARNTSAVHAGTIKIFQRSLGHNAHRRHDECNQGARLKQNCSHIYFMIKSCRKSFLPKIAYFGFVQFKSFRTTDVTPWKKADLCFPSNVFARYFGTATKNSCSLGYISLVLGVKTILGFSICNFSISSDKVRG